MEEVNKETKQMQMAWRTYLINLEEMVNKYKFEARQKLR
jgi:hypothetical protein